MFMALYIGIAKTDQNIIMAINKQQLKVSFESR
jgi:hypothetical protein